MKKLLKLYFALLIVGLAFMGCPLQHQEIVQEIVQNTQNKINLEKDKNLIMTRNYAIPLANQGDQNSKTQWVQDEINDLIENGSIATVKFSDNKYSVELKNGEETENITITVTENTEALKETGLKEVKVKQILATVDPNNEIIYIASIPASEITLADLTKDDITIISKDRNATVSDPTSSDSGETWQFTITAEDTSVKQNYTLKLIKSDSIIITEIKNDQGVMYSTAEKTPWTSFALLGHNITEENKTKVKCKVTKDSAECTNVTIDDVKLSTSPLSGQSFYLLKITFPRNETNNPITYVVSFSIDGGNTFANEKSVIVENKGGNDITPPGGI